MLPEVRLQRLPRVADFALWAAACESAFRPAGSFEAAYSHNRREAIDNIVDADRVAAYVREIMAERTHWTGSASDLLSAGTSAASNSMGWAGLAGPRALAHSLGGCGGRRHFSAHSGLRLSSAGRGGWELGQSG
jgi:hypothetical protein